jgi:hypothetical protein
MKCLSCGSSYNRRVGSLEVDDPFVGSYSVADSVYFECPKCHERLLTPDTLGKIEEGRRRKLEDWLRNQPFGNFVSASEAARLLKVSRQALHKSRKFRIGLIYGALLDGKRYYYRPSLFQYLRTGDGRLPIAQAPEVAALGNAYVGAVSQDSSQRHAWAAARLAAAASIPAIVKNTGTVQPAYAGMGRPQRKAS